MGSIHSIDTCSGGDESKKGSLWSAPSEHDLDTLMEMNEKYGSRQSQKNRQQQQHPTDQNRATSPKRRSSGQRMLGIFHFHHGHHHQDNNHHQHRRTSNGSTDQQQQQQQTEQSVSYDEAQSSLKNNQQQTNDYTHTQQEEHPHNNSSHHLSSSLKKGRFSKRISRPSFRRVRQASSSMLRGSKRLLFHHHHPSNTTNQHHHHGMDQDDQEHNKVKNDTDDHKNNNSGRGGSSKHRWNLESRHSRRQNRSIHRNQQKQKQKQKTKKKPTPCIATKVRGGVLLHGCFTDEEHKAKIQQVLDLLRKSESTGRTFATESLSGHDALIKCGFEYRSVQLQHDGRPVMSSPTNVDGSVFASSIGTSPKASETIQSNNSDIFNDNKSNDTSDEHQPERDAHQPPPQHMNMLFHIETNTLITMQNRKRYIADGDMYDAIARAAMEYAQEKMIEKGELEWVTVEESGNNAEPIRALISRRLLEDESRLDTEPTLLLVTGKGKVRAGIFSRQHLLVSGMECSTAIPIVQEAKMRNMNVIMLDPNCHGDRLGMETFEKSMSRVFRRWEQDQDWKDDTKISSQDNNKNHNTQSDRSSDSSSSLICGDNQLSSIHQHDLFVLSHSQSGAQFQRYLLDKYEHYIPHIRAICFTDSTHNIQWTKDKHELKELLESNRSVYFKCAEQTNDPLLQPLPTLGEKVQTDGFWRHRFGSIRTLCAGTSEHSLTNYFVRDEMWKHFDSHSLRLQLKGNENSTIDEMKVADQ